jgi:hypothetical protein
MKKLFAAALLLTAGFSMSAHAGLISGPITFDGGKSVDLQGLEWMPLTYTAGLSRNVVEGNNGFTDNFGGSWKKGDWRYATRNETEKLLGSLWGGRYDGWSYDNFVGASTFFQLFGATVRYSDAYNGSFFMFGNFEQCDAPTEYTCVGQVRMYQSYPGELWAPDRQNEWQQTLSYNPAFHEGMAYFLESGGVDMSRHARNDTYPMGWNSTQIGSLLVRDVDTVSSPAPLSLFALGLCGLLLRRRKIAA